MDSIGLLDKIFNIIVSADLQRALTPIRIIFISISVLLAVTIIWLFQIATYKNYLILDWWHDFKLLRRIRAGLLEEGEQKEAPAIPKEAQKVQISDWQRILDKVNTRNELKCKLAVIDANRLLEKELKGKNISSLSNYEELKKVKEYIERLLDEPKKGIGLKNTKKIIAVYKKALEELGAI